MSEYKRWISYVYSYVNDEKKNNVGYVKVEIRGNKTKISVHINVLSVAEAMKVYLYHRMGGIMRGIYIGDITPDKGVGKKAFNIDTVIAPDNINVSQSGGLIVYCSDEKYFATEWDDIPISVRKFYIHGEKMPEMEFEEKLRENSVEKFDERTDEKSGEKSNGKADGMSGEKSCDDHDIELEDRLSVDNIDVIATSEDVHSASSVRPIVGVAPDSSVRPIVGAAPDSSVTSPGTPLSIGKAADIMLETYPRMFPFENDESAVCVRIEPQDIGRLPIDTWYIANNSFLLHGYYSYRHLILLKTEENKPSYIIGVPGIYHNRDEYMAKMFGFGLFRPMKDCQELRGEFGYWCISLTDIGDSKEYK